MQSIVDRQSIAKWKINIITKSNIKIINKAKEIKIVHQTKRTSQYPRIIQPVRVLANYRHNNLHNGKIICFMGRANIYLQIISTLKEFFKMESRNQDNIIMQTTMLTQASSKISNRMKKEELILTRKIITNYKTKRIATCKAKVNSILILRGSSLTVCKKVMAIYQKHPSFKFLGNGNMESSSMARLLVLAQIHPLVFVSKRTLTALINFTKVNLAIVFSMVPASSSSLTNHLTLAHFKKVNFMEKEKQSIKTAMFMRDYSSMLKGVDKAVTIIIIKIYIEEISIMIKQLEMVRLNIKMETFTEDNLTVT